MTIPNGYLFGNSTPILTCGTSGKHCSKLYSAECRCNESAPPPASFASLVKTLTDGGVARGMAVSIVAECLPQLHREWLARGGGKL